LLIRDALVRRLVVDQPPAVRLDASERRPRLDLLDAVAEEAAPIERRDVVESGNDLVERVGTERGLAALPAVEAAAEVVERAAALGLPADRGVGLQPDEDRFVVEVRAPPPGAPLPGRPIEDLRGHRGVRQRPPGPSRRMVETRRDEGDALAVVLRSPQAAAGGEQQAEVLRQALVDPEQLALHRLLVIGSRETRRPAVLAVPGMDVLVREERSEAAAPALVAQRLFEEPVVARFVVLESEMLHVVAQRDEPLIMPVVAGAEQRTRLLRQACVRLGEAGGQLNGGGGVGGDVDLVRRPLTCGQRDLDEMRAGGPANRRGW